MTQKQQSNFWDKVVKLATEAGCWLWVGATNPNGYGTISINKKFHKAHRVSYRIANGPFPENLHVCHRCDTPACVNPSHLFLGTVKDNMRDCKAKGRFSRPPTQKLTTDEVFQIKEALKIDSSMKNREILGLKFKVRTPTVTAILKGKRWSSLR